MKKFISVMFAVALAVMMVVPAFAYTPYQPFTVDDMTEDMYSDYRSGKVYFTLWDDFYMARLTMSTSPLIYQPNGSNGVLTPTSNGKYTTYQWTGNAWVIMGSGATENGSLLYNNCYAVKWSNYDVKNSSGSVVYNGDETFPPAPPLAEQVQKVTEEELTAKTVPELGRVVMILVTVAVGCLASLVLLRVFRTQFGHWLKSR